MLRPLNNKELSDKIELLRPSQMIRLALADLARVEKNPNYVVDMTDWYKPSHWGRPCAVCFAGAVLTQTVGLGIEAEEWDALDATALGISEKAHNRILALDNFRVGCVSAGMWSGWKELVQGKPSALGEALDALDTQLMIVPDYKDNPQGFKDTMKKLADDLNKLGL